eukprot:Transcript_13308.p1 GENE.Transcript_13308~~Transcript_13308.p1  ORF type:complete len:119 (+),score=25.08 Transcript_13308:137-493(+)
MTSLSSAVEYLAVVAADRDDGPRLLRRFPTQPRAATPFPPLLTAFALPDGAAPTVSPPPGGVASAVLTLQDSTRIHMVSLYYYERHARSKLWTPVALCALSQSPHLAFLHAALPRTLR